MTLSATKKLTALRAWQWERRAAIEKELADLRALRENLLTQKVEARVA